MSPARYTTARDNSGTPVEGAAPEATAVARTVATLTQQVMIELNTETRLLTVYAIAKDVYLHWADDSEDYGTAENFDEVVIAGSQALISVPTKADGSRYGFASILGRESGASAVVIEK